MPSLSGAQFGSAIPDLAYELFGEAAFVPGRSFLEPAVFVCMKSILATTYNRWRKQMGSFKRALERKRVTMNNLERGECAHGRPIWRIPDSNSHLRT